MAKFNIGDKIYNREEPNRICRVVDINTVTSYIPNYTLHDEEGGYTFESFCLEGWHKVVTDEDALRYGNVLTDDELHYEIKGHVTVCPIYKRIRTISYDNRIFYHKMVNGEVVEFKELAV